MEPNFAGVYIDTRCFLFGWFCFAIADNIIMNNLFHDSSWCPCVRISVGLKPGEGMVMWQVIYIFNLHNDKLFSNVIIVIYTPSYTR